MYPANIQGIIVLGGSYDTVSHGYMSTIVLQGGYRAVGCHGRSRSPISPPQDYLQWRNNLPMSEEPSEADIVKDYFVSFGIAPNRILTESQSQTTEENARFTAPSAAANSIIPLAARHISLIKCRAPWELSGRPALTSPLFRWLSDAWLGRHVEARGYR